MNDRPPIPSTIRNRSDFDRLLAATTNYEETLPRDGSKQVFDLTRMEALLGSVGNPEHGPRVAHVAGSKGKGTVARLIAHGLGHDPGTRAHPVGLFTSPHLIDLSERIAVDGRAASDPALASAADTLLPHLRAVQGTSLAPTFFELVTGVAWLVFREAGCANVVLETGLGGRLDSTNVCDPSVTVITTIELEHTRLLGDTIAAIAGEKAGILKRSVPAVTTATGEAVEVIQAVADALDVRLCRVHDDLAISGVSTGPGRRLAFDVTGVGTTHVEVPLAGVHHVENVVAAEYALRILGARAPAASLADADLPGLLEPVAADPLVLVDGAHTPRSAEATRAALTACWPDRRLVLLTAMLEEKHHAEVGRALSKDGAHVVVTQVSSPRCVPADQLATTIRGVTEIPVVVVDSPAEALERARALAGPDGIVLASGSVYLAGDVKALCAAS